MVGRPGRAVTGERLDELLASATGTVAKSRCRRLLSFPWIWPAEPTSQAAAVKLHANRPRGAAPGEVLLVSIGNASAQAGLWRLRPGRPGGSIGRFALGPVALESRHRASRLATRDLPVLSAARELPLDRWEVDAIVSEEAVEPRTLDGPSYGGAFLLASASLLLERPVPADLACSADLQPDGRFLPVGGVTQKVDYVCRMARGVRRFAVAHDQLNEARTAAAGRIEVLPIRDARALLNVAFGIIAPAWTTSERALEAVEGLLRIALYGSQLLGWGCVAEAAQHAEKFLAGDAVACEKAAFIRHVARRHMGHPEPLRWPEPETPTWLCKPARMVHLAHVLSAAIDSADAELAHKVERARELVPQPDRCHEEELMLRGAIGRAEARLRRYMEAAGTLRAVVDAWFAIFKGAQASHAYCELVRVTGILGDREALEALDALTPRLFAEPGFTFLSEAYARTALGRAWVTVGDARRAMTHLADAAFPWDELNAELIPARLRWLAKAHGPTTPEAAGLRAVINGLASDSLPARIQQLLASVDLAIARGSREGDLEAIVAELSKPPVEPYIRFIPGASTEERIRRVAVEFPY